MDSSADRKGRPSGFRQQRATIGGLMVIVAAVALSAWVFRTAIHQERPLAFLLAFLVGFPMIAGPIVIKWKRWISDDPRYEPIDPGSDQVPRIVVESIVENVPKMEMLGFRCLGHCRSDRITANSASYVTLFEHPRARRTAHLFTVFVATGPIRQVATVLSFRTDFADGTSLTTGNSRNAGTFPPVRLRKGSMSFPWIVEPRQLYEIHETSVSHYAADGIALEPNIPDTAEFLRSSSRQEVAKFAEVGYVRLDEPRRIYRYTWKGAVLMTWKLTWPIRPIRQMLRRRRAARILRELGLEGALRAAGR